MSNQQQLIFILPPPYSPPSAYNLCSALSILPPTHLKVHSYWFSQAWLRTTWNDRWTMQSRDRQGVRVLTVENRFVWLLFPTVANDWTTEQQYCSFQVFLLCLTMVRCSLSISLLCLGLDSLRLNWQLASTTGPFLLQPILKVKITWPIFKAMLSAEWMGESQ